MKKIIFLILIVALGMTLTCAFANMEVPKTHKMDIQPYILDISQIAEAPKGITLKNERVAETLTVPLFKLPNGLRIIEDEAFEGTAIAIIDLPEGLESIGDKAFASIPTLLNVKIPGEATFIAKTAFSGSYNVTISGAPGDYSKVFAKENGIPFIPSIVMLAETGNVQISANVYNSRQTRLDVDLIKSAEKTLENPQWRLIGEIKEKQNDGCIANHISGRSPPLCA